MGLFRKIACFAYYIIFARKYGGDICGGIWIDFYCHEVSYRHWVGGPYSFESEVSFYAAFYNFVVLSEHDVRASGIPCYQSFHMQIKKYACESSFYLKKISGFVRGT